MNAACCLQGWCCLICVAWCLLFVMMVGACCLLFADCVLLLVWRCVLFVVC